MAPCAGLTAPIVADWGLRPALTRARADRYHMPVLPAGAVGSCRQLSLRTALLIARPIRRPVLAQLVEDAPGVQPRIVAVVKEQAQRIVAHGLHSADPDLLLSEHQRALAAAMAFHLGRGRKHAQV